MTELTITPKVADKTARFKGTIAAGEHVAVTIKGGAEWIGTDSGANLTLRVLDLVTGRTLAVFPRPTETLDEGESPDAWSTSLEDANDLYCELNLNTNRMVAAARHMLRVPVMFVLGDTDDPRTLYFRDRYEVEYWPERIGDTVPYDLDKWPKKIDEWTELVAGWTARLNGLKLEAERTEAVGTTPGKTKITLNDGTAEEDTVVEILDGQVSADQLASAVSELEDAIDEKQDALTFDDAPTANSANPVKSGGVKTAIDTVATNLSTHTGNSGIHVTADQKSEWTAKYAKPSGGIPASDLAGEIGKAKLTSSVQGSLDKADTAVQPGALAAYVNGASYDSTEKKILFKHGSSTIAYIDATAFIKDGMVSSVAISNGYLVITFNTDAGASPISIALTDIFNPANYYDKTAADGRFVQKETGKGLVAVDAALTTSGAAADAKAVGDALRGGFTEWVCDEISDGWTFVSCEWYTVSEIGTGWFATLGNGSITISVFLGGNADSVNLEIEAQHGDPGVELSRHVFPPTKTSQLTNDGAPNGGGNAYVMTNDTRLTDARTPTGHHATHSTGGTDAIAPADIGAAAASDLPYRLVEPGEWEFSGSGVQDGVEYWLEIVDGGADAEYNLYDGAMLASETRSGVNETVINFASVNITATRASLPGHLLDRAVNAVSVTGATTLTLPALVNAGKARDFLVKVTTSADDLNITWQGQGSEAPDGADELQFVTEDGDFPVVGTAGDYVFSFTEVEPHTFAVSMKPIVAAPQAQGGS